MSDVWVIEHGSDPRPARIVSSFKAGGFDQTRDMNRVAFTDERGGERVCFSDSVFATKAEAVRAEREMELK